MNLTVWSLIWLRAGVGLFAFGLCVVLFLHIRRDRTAMLLAGENGMKAEILTGEMRGLRSEGKWLLAMAITASIRVVSEVVGWLHGETSPPWDVGALLGTIVILAFTMDSVWVIVAKRRERQRLFTLAAAIRRGGEV